MQKRWGSLSLVLVTWLGVACGGSQPRAATSPSPSSSPTAPSSPFFDPAPRQLVAGFSAGIGGNMACSGSHLVFTDGPMHVLYGTGTAEFAPRRLLSVPGSIGPISMSGDWAAFTVYTQAAGQLSPLAAWTVYAIQITTRRVLRLAAGTNQTELTEMPRPTVGDGFVVWDELMPGAGKVLWLYQVDSGGTRRIGLPAGTYPVAPSAVGRNVLFMDNSHDPNHSSEIWVGRGGEPILLNLDTGRITDLLPGSTVFDSVLTATRAAWINGGPGGTGEVVQEMSPLLNGRVQTLAAIDSVAPIWANDRITIWLAGIRGEVTAHSGVRTAVVSPDLTSSPGGIALCGHDLYYAGPNLSLRVAHIG